MISDDIKREIIELYSRNNSIAKISKQVSISTTTITKILKSNGVAIRKCNYQNLDIDEMAVNKMYSEGQSTYSIAKHFSCSDETIRKMITQLRPPTIRNKLKQESIDKISKISKDNWQNEDYIAKVKVGTSTPCYKQSLSSHGRRNYESSLGKWLRTEEARTVLSNAARALWADQSYRLKRSAWLNSRIPDLIAASKKALEDPIKRAAWIDKIRKNTAARPNDGWVSSSQKQLYYILSTSGIDYIEEGHGTKIGPFYVVDCVIPKQQNMAKPLIVEVQGEYWHSLPHVMLKDKQKATYIRNHTDYDLLTIDELNLKSFTEVESKLNAFGITLAKTICKPKELIIKQITEADASMFYSVFHYSGSIRKGAITFGAFVGDELVAAISYCHPMRKQTASNLKFAYNEVIEISRMARKTNLVCRNLSSYLISKTMPLLPRTIKCVISFSDATYNHTGSVYKAAGFTNHGTIAPDYHYISINGKYHKKTIWDRSKKMKMTESDYADQHHLMKVFGKEKTKWVFER